jgi:mRNA-degrading endonuclease RelE of RelBE toxin-antitoxin system
MADPGHAWTQQAVEALLDLAGQDRRQARRILEAVRQYATTGTGDIKKLQGQRDEWRLRVGDWRVIFSLRSGEIIVLDILNRRDAYR